MVEPLSARVAMLGVGACSCGVKTPLVHFHEPTCLYRRILEIADEVEALEDRETELEARVEKAEAARDEAADTAADYVLDTLSQALGNPEYAPCDGSETWEGDVGGTVYAILHAAKVLDPETDELATARAEKAEAALNDALETLGQERAVSKTIGEELDRRNAELARLRARFARAALRSLRRPETGGS